MGYTEVTVQKDKQAIEVKIVLDLVLI